MRLDALLLGVYDKAKQGGLSEIDRVLAIEAARAKLLGLNAPVAAKHQHSGADGSPIVLTVAEMEEAAASFDAKVKLNLAALAAKESAPALPDVGIEAAAVEKRLLT